MNRPSRLLLVCGTRPEAIKMAPLMRLLVATPGLEARFCSTGQHREMLAQALSLFDLSPDVDLDVMRAGQGLVDVSVAVMQGLRDTFADWEPDRVLVHGDTNTTAAATLAAYYHRIPVFHVEAGLRTGNLLSPWPEEGNRRLVGSLATRHYAPTSEARANLLAENVSADSVLVTGNTVIDALLAVADRLEKDAEFAAKADSELEFLDPAKRLVLVTGHRRENFGKGFEDICLALGKVSARQDVQIVYPVHLNPSVREPVERLLADRDNLHLVEPMSYLPFVRLMSRAHLIVTDSGGIQEEAPALGKPVLVMRETTERPEAVAAGTVRLVGTNPDRMISEIEKLLDDPAHHERMSLASNPYGTGDACRRIVKDIVGASPAGSGHSSGSVPAS